MLNGIAPIIIFTFKKLAPDLLQSINALPLLANNKIVVPLIPIPIYLDEKITGVYVTSHSKNIDIDNRVQTKADGKTPKIEQIGIDSTITINMIASTNSLALTVLSALCDVIFPKVTSEEYSISYLNGGIAAFGALLHSFSITQDGNNNLYNMSLVLSKASSQSTIAEETTPIIDSSLGAVPGISLA